MTRALALVVLAALSCGPGLPPAALAEAGPESRATDQANLLLFPQADAEALLGRAASLSADGSWTIADARAPGCEVIVRREKAAFKSTRRVDAHMMTSVAGGYAKVVSLEMKFGRQNTADITVDNTEILRADTRGACGDSFVDTVFVGRGKRTIAASAVAGARADVNAGVVSASPKVDAQRAQTDAIEWTDDQAYGFTTRKNAKIEPLDLHVSIPSVVNEGDDVKVTFEAGAPAWLVVYYLDASGHADVLWPSNEEPAPKVAPGAVATLPSKGEAAQGFHLRAALLTKGVPSRETLVVYGFADKHDFDAMKPEVAGSSADGAAFASELTKKLGSVPMSRWSRAVAAYVIQPKR